MPPRARPAFSLHPADLAFGALASFLIGIFAAGMGWPVVAVLLVALASCAMAVLARPRLARECCLFLAALLAGVFYYHAFFAIQALRTNLPIGRQAAFTALIADEPQPTQYGSIMLTVSALPPLRGKVTLFASAGASSADLGYGDLINVTGTIAASARLGEAPSISRPEISCIASHKGFFLREWMIRLKNAILGKFREELPADEAALLGGIAFGSRAAFSPELKSAMSLSGTTHLVAVSGYNITIVIVAAGALFGRFFGRRAAFAAAIVLLVAFMLMVGSQASAMRAAIMGFVGLVGRELGEAASMRNLVTFTAAAMALADPSALTANVGFALSFASLLGIVYLGPAARRLLRCDSAGGAGARGNSATSGSSVFGLRESAATTISAQLAVMPILIRTFGQFSLTAVFANMLIIATVPLIMFLGAVLAALIFLSQFTAFFAAKLVGLLLGYQLFVIRLFATLAAPFPVSFNSETFVAFYYFLLAIVVFSHRRETGSFAP